MDAALVFIVDILFAFLGRVFIRCVSFGHWQTEAWGGGDSSHLAPAGALSFVRNHRRVFTHTGQQFAGLAFVILLAVLGVVYANAA
jgi:hypothetical protein